MKHNNDLFRFDLVSNRYEPFYQPWLNRFKPLTHFYTTKTEKSPSTETKTSIPLNLQIGVYYHVGRIVGYNIKHISSCQEDPADQ